MVYLILFDLSRSERHYRKLMNEIQGLGKANRILQHAFMVNCELSASQIYFNLKKFIEEDDNLLVLQAGKDWFGFLPLEKLNWIQEVLG